MSDFEPHFVRQKELKFPFLQRGNQQKQAGLWKDSESESITCVWRQGCKIGWKPSFSEHWYMEQVDLWIASAACADRKLNFPSQQQWYSEIEAIRHCRGQKSVTSQNARIKRILNTSTLSPLSNQNTRSQAYTTQTRKFLSAELDPPKRGNL